MTGRILVGLLLVAIISTGVAGASGARATTVVPWTEVRAAVGATICVGTQKAAEKEYTYEAIGERAACGAPPAATPLARAVDRAFEAVSPVVLMHLAPGAPAELYMDKPSAERSGLFGRTASPTKSSCEFSCRA